MWFVRCSPRTPAPSYVADREPTPIGRWPDFLVIGAMKAGTTTLFDWLGQGDDVALPSVKEPEHLAASTFGPDEQRDYRALFATPLLTGEASVRYGWPWEAERVARRIAELRRRPRLIFVAREPEARLRSDYCHGVLRGRERRLFTEAIADPAAAPVRRSEYSATLATYRAVLGEAPHVMLVDAASFVPDFDIQALLVRTVTGGDVDAA